MTIRDGWGRPFTPEEFDELWARNRELAAKLARLVEEPCPTQTGDDIDIKEYLREVKTRLSERRCEEDRTIAEIEKELWGDFTTSERYSEFTRLMRLDEIREQQKRFGADFKIAQKNTNRQKVTAALNRAKGKKAGALTLFIARMTGLSERTVDRHLKEILTRSK
jgi:hypothetical protein